MPWKHTGSTLCLLTGVSPQLATYHQMSEVIRVLAVIVTVIYFGLVLVALFNWFIRKISK